MDGLPLPGCRTGLTAFVRRTDGSQMTDSNSPSNWDSLISDLGVTPPPEEKPRQAARPSQPRPVKKPAAPRPRPAAAPAASWDAIASQLGVTPAPEPVAPRPAPAAAAAGGPAGGNRRCGAAQVRAAAA